MKIKNFTHIKMPVIKELESFSIGGSRFYKIPYREKDSFIIIPSVTTVLDCYNVDTHQAVKEWRKRVGDAEANQITQVAKSRGTEFHSVAEKYLKNDPDFLKGVFPDVKEMFLIAQPYLDKIDNIRYQEVCLYDPSMNVAVAGRCDLVADYEGTPSIIDFKSARYSKDKEDIEHYFEQTSLYSNLYIRQIYYRSHEFADYKPKPHDQLVILMVSNQHPEPLIFKDQIDAHIGKASAKVLQWHNKEGIDTLAATKFNKDLIQTARDTKALAYDPLE